MLSGWKENSMICNTRAKCERSKKNDRRTWRKYALISALIHV